jgi:hypothetical protein
MQPLFVLLNSVENGSIITIQHHASCCYHRRIPCFKSEFHVLKSRGYRAYQLYNLVLSTILAASESSLERREVKELLCKEGPQTQQGVLVDQENLCLMGTRAPSYSFVTSCLCTIPQY